MESRGNLILASLAPGPSLGSSPRRSHWPVRNAFVSNTRPFEAKPSTHGRIDRSWSNLVFALNTKSHTEESFRVSKSQKERERWPNSSPPPAPSRLGTCGILACESNPARAPIGLSKIRDFRKTPNRADHLSLIRSRFDLFADLARRNLNLNQPS